MSSRRNRRETQTATSQRIEGEHLMQAAGDQSMAFTFGDPVPVFDGEEILDTGVLVQWPLVRAAGSAESTGEVEGQLYLQSGLSFKRNPLARTFIPHSLLSRQALSRSSWTGVRQATYAWRSATTCFARRSALRRAWPNTFAAVPTLTSVTG